MKHFMRIVSAGLGIALVVAANEAVAGEAADQLKDSIEKVLAILNNPDLEEAERRKLIREVADNRFNWTAMARSAMGIYQNMPECPAL